MFKKKNVSAFIFGILSLRETVQGLYYQSFLVTEDRPAHYLIERRDSALEKLGLLAVG